MAGFMEENWRKAQLNKGMMNSKLRKQKEEQEDDRKKRLSRNPEVFLYDDERGRMYQHYDTEEAIHNVGQRKDRIKPTDRQKNINKATDKMYQRYQEWKASKKK